MNTPPVVSNSTQSNNTTEIQANTVGTFFNTVLIPIFGCLGVVTNSFCILILSQTEINKNTKGNMYRYFLLKSVFNLGVSLAKALNNLTVCDQVTCRGVYSLVVQYLYIWIAGYISLLTELCIAIFEVLAVFDRLMSVQRSFSSLKCLLSQRTLVISSSVTIFFSCTFQVYRIFEYKVVEKNSNSSQSYFVSESSDFAKTNLDAALKFTNAAIRDIACLILVNVGNGLLLVLFRQNSKRSRSIRGNGETNKMKAAERRATILSIVTGLSFTVCHAPIGIYYSPFDKSQNPVFWSNFFYVALFFLTISFPIDIVFYYSFNKKFRSILISLLCKKKNSNQQPTI